VMPGSSHFREATSDEPSLGPKDEAIDVSVGEHSFVCLCSLLSGL
jgi:hypothetical protein